MSVHLHISLKTKQRQKIFALRILAFLFPFLGLLVRQKPLVYVLLSPSENAEGSVIEMAKQR